MTMENTASTPSVHDMTMKNEGVEKKNLFQAVDYVVFGCMLLVSALIGVYFAVKSRKKSATTTEDYLMASRNMSFGPVSLSLIASFMSSVTILGVPAEFYVYGTMFSWFAVLYAVMPVLIGWVYMPVFYDLGINSTYEYLERRFNRATRLITTFMFIILTALYGGIVVYGPALALNEATGFDLWIAIFTTGIVCIFYTTLGGLKAVIWTDVFQAFVMISGFIAIIIQGSINFGGFQNIWKAAESGGRIDFIHFEFDPRIRNTFWSIQFGGIVLWLGINAVSQTQVQRYVCCKTKRDAQIAIMLNGLGLVVILILAGMTGLTIYATYKDCDLLDTKKVSKSDQLFPYAVMDLLGHLPGVPGLFVAGIYSSSLSTLSSAMNAMACVTLEDFLKPYTKWRSKTYSIVSKCLVLGFGILFIIIAFLASQIGGLIKMTYSVHGVIGGPIVGLFTLGIMVPFVNQWGGLFGVICGWASTIWLLVGSALYPTPAEFLQVLPRSTEGCNLTSSVDTTSFNSTSAGYSSSPVTDTSSEVETSFLLDFYHLSYLYVAAVGCLTTLVVGILVSLITGLNFKSPPSRELLLSIYSKPRKNDKPMLERSSSWYSPSDVANAQRISIKLSKTPGNGEWEPLQNIPDGMATLREDNFIPEKESSF